MTTDNDRPSTGQVIQSVGCLLMAIPAFVFFLLLAYFLFTGGD
jgi:hypothetical protein